MCACTEWMVMHVALIVIFPMPTPGSIKFQNMLPQHRGEPRVTVTRRSKFAPGSLPMFSLTLHPRRFPLEALLVLALAGVFVMVCVASIVLLPEVSKESVGEVKLYHYCSSPTR